MLPPFGLSKTCHS